jgi:uncharacterized membrane protein
MMTGLLVLNTVLALLILAMAWMMPALSRPTLPFGVRVPANYVGAPVIAERRRAYRQWIALAGGAVVVVGVAVALLVNQALSVLTLLVFLVIVPGYVRAHRAIEETKQREQWYHGLRQAVATDTSLRTDPERFPWLWAIPAVLLLVATAVLGIIRYPDLPPTLAMHYNADGVADRIVATTVGSAFVLVFVEAGITVMILALTLLSFRSRPDLDAAAPAATSRQHRGFVRRMSKGILLLGACANATMLMVAWQIWSGQSFSVFVVVLPVLLGVVVLLVFAVRTGQDRSRLDDEETGLVQRDDDRYWRGAGMFYVNRDDPALFVPKRVGVGWTVNFANPRGLWLILVLLAIVLIPVFVA